MHRVEPEVGRKEELLGRNRGFAVAVDGGVGDRRNGIGVGGDSSCLGWRRRGRDSRVGWWTLRGAVDTHRIVDSVKAFE